MNKTIIAPILISTLNVPALIYIQPAAMAQNIRSVAQVITVRIDGPGSEKNNGSGVLIEKQGNTYKVLTNWHVAGGQGRYTLQTFDGKKYTPTKIQQLRGADLAIMEFTSSTNYQLATKGNSDNLPQGIAIYAAGWFNPGPAVSERIFDVPQGQFVSYSPRGKDGYTFIYRLDIATPGISGGPILNERGELIAINGQAFQDARVGGVAYLGGIPINTFNGILGYGNTPSTANDKPTNSSLPPAQNQSLGRNEIIAAAANANQDLMYQRLEQYLNEGNFRKADEQTWELMKKIGVKDEDYSDRLSSEEIKNFSCQDLGRIDYLWVKYSGGKFGISVQRDIYASVGGKVNNASDDTYETWWRFAIAVGWHDGVEFGSSTGWIDYDDLTFAPWAKKGHLPNGLRRKTPEAISRYVKCKL